MGERQIGASESASPWRSPAPLVDHPAPVDGSPDEPAAPVASSDTDSHRQLQTLAFELTVAEARERQRIAQVLHDDMGQLLAMAQFKLSDLISNLVNDPHVRDPLEEVRQLLCEAAKATRTATYELYSPVLQQLGLLAAVEGLAQQLQRDSRMWVHVTSNVGVLPLSEPVLSVLFRIVRELAFNAQKHAECRHLWISLDQDKAGLRIDLADDGVGFDADAALHRFSPEGGFGLVSAEAQMQAVGGHLSIESVPGGGTIASLGLAFHVAAAMPSGATSPTTIVHPSSHP